MIFKFIILFLSATIFFLYFDKINNKFNLFDNPDFVRKIHKNKVPFSGGLFILFLFNIYTTLFFFDENFYYNFEITNNFYFVFIANLLFLLGFVDDLKKISIQNRIFFFFILIFIFIYNSNLYVSYIRIDFLKIQISIIPIKYLFTALCFFVFYNSLNMYDGINGQSSIYLIFVFTIFFIFFDHNFIFLFFIISLVLFLCFNLKNRVFLGNSGVIFFSFIVSVIIIDLYNKNKILYADEILLIMFLPVIEMIRLFFFRIFNNKNPFVADKTHIHHILINNFNLYYTLLITGCIAIMPFFFYKLNINFFYIFFIFIFIYFLLIYYFNRKYKKLN